MILALGLEAFHWEGTVERKGSYSNPIDAGNSFGRYIALHSNIACVIRCTSMHRLY